MRSFACLTSSILCGCAAVACHSASEPARTPPDDVAFFAAVTYTATTEVLESYPVLLRTTLDFHNPNRFPLTLEFNNGCMAWLRAYRTPERRALVWDHGAVLACTQALSLIDLPAGGRRQITVKTNARDILGDSLPDGRYYFTAFLKPNGAIVEIQAGEADLAVPR